MKNLELQKTRLMACGCSSNAYMWDKNQERYVPSCAVHGVTEIALEPPTLTGRQARCSMGCKKTRASNLNLAFFEYRSGKEFDLYYCGCRGWD